MSAGDVIYLAPGERHALTAVSPCRMQLVMVDVDKIDAVWPAGAHFSAGAVVVVGGLFAVGCRDAGDLARFTVGRALAVAQGVGGFDDAARCVVFVAGFAAQRVLAFGCDFWLRQRGYLCD